MFKRNDKADINETSFHGVEVVASMETMARLFGPPGQGDGGYKTKHEWVFEGEGFNVAVYDYKYDGSISGNWHVGAESSFKAKKFAKWFNSYVAKQ